MKKLKIDLNELVSEMEMGDNLELTGYLDTETGEIISMPDSVMRAVEDGEEEIAALADWVEELAEVAENILGDEKNRFLLIPKRESREGFEIMAAFAESEKMKGLREKLSLALNGKGAFRRFRSVLNYYPDELERWYKFKDDWMREEAVERLILNGIEPVQVISGYFNDDGTKINADLVPKPGKKDTVSGRVDSLHD